MGNYVSTGSKIVDEVFPKGFPPKVISGIFAQYDIGKSFLLLQTASNHTAKDEGKTLYIDTEGFLSRDEDKDRILSYFIDRFSMSEDPDIDLLFPPDIHNVYELLGKGLTIFPKKNRKGEVSKIDAQIWDETPLEKAPLYKKLDSKEYSFVVLDSFTMIIKKAVPALRQNFGTRANVEEGVLGRLDTLARKFEIPVVVTAHGSTDPTNPYDTGSPGVSSSWRYHVKHVMQIRGNPKKEKRTLVRFRYPGLTSVRTKKEGKDCKLAENRGFIP